MEEWRNIIGYENYQVSNTGKVRSLKFNKILELKSNIESGGYKYVNLYNGVRKTFKIHRLVAITFLNNPENKPCVNHINGNKLDNNLYNLEWNTVSENTKHAYDIGLR